MSDKISSGVACDGKSVFIEVTGIKHGPEHAIQFYDESNKTQQETLENKVLTEEVIDTSIYSWEWCDQKAPINAWLAIKSDTGVIKLPLFTDIQAKKRAKGEQDYLLHAVMPLTLLPTYKTDDISLSEKARLAPVRNGYIYVFYNHKAWREIEISTQDDGSVKLNDIDLYSYREGKDKPFKDKKRIAVGQDLNEIWLPAKDNKNSIDIHLAYSEVQWSAPRLNYLELNKKELTERAIAFNSIKIDGDVKIRIREPEIELLVAEPIKHSRDLSGTWLNEQYQKIKSDILEANNDSEKAQVLFMRIPDYAYEYGMKLDALKQILSPDPDAEKKWKEKSSVNYLSDAQQRKLRSIVLDDPLFDLRHRSFLVMSGVAYMQQLYIDMSQQEYYQCAELVQRMVIPKKFGKNENPFYEHKDEFDTHLGGRFHRTLRTLERISVCSDVKQLQQHTESQMDLARTATVLRDITSLNDGNAKAAYVIAGYGISALNIDIDMLDTFGDPDNVPSSKYLKTVQKILSSENLHPLHSVLIPPESSVPVEDKYTPPAPFNSGSGFASTESLALWATDNFIINEKNLSIMDLSFMLDATDNKEGNFAAERRIAHTTDGIFRGYFQALMSLSKEIAEVSKEIVVIEFNSVYVSMIRLLKATDPKFWGDVRYVPVGGTELKGTVIGVEGHGLKHGLTAQDRVVINKRKNKTSMAQLFNSKDNSLIATTGKKAFKKQSSKSKIGEKLPLKVLVVPEGSNFLTSFNRASIERSLLDMDKKGFTASNSYEKLKIPYFLVVIEMINLKNNLKYFELLKKDTVYAGSNIASAVLDLTIAIIHASNLYTQNASKLAMASQKTAITMKASWIKKLTFGKNAVELVGRISVLNTASIGAGFLTVAILGWDSARLFQHNDTDAALAMGMAATGTLMTTIATGFFVTSAPLLFGMGPIAWLGIGISIAGFLLYSIFKDSAIEVWLKNGPFGEEPDDDFAHLQDNKIAFNRFIGLLFRVSCKTSRLDHKTAFPKVTIDDTRSEDATHIIWLNTNLASLLNPNLVDVQFYVREAIQCDTATIGFKGVISHSLNIIKQEKSDLNIIGQFKTASGYAFFVKHEIDIPSKLHKSVFRRTRSSFQTFLPAFVIRVRLNVADTFFPTLALDEPNNSEYVSSTPSFKNDEKRWLKLVVIG